MRWLVLTRKYYFDHNDGISLNKMHVPNYVTVAKASPGNSNKPILAKISPIIHRLLKHLYLNRRNERRRYGSFILSQAHAQRLRVRRHHYLVIRAQPVGVILARVHHAPLRAVDYLIENRWFPVIVEAEVEIGGPYEEFGAFENVEIVTELVEFRFGEVTEG